MVQPNLIHPIPIVIQQLSKGSTMYDPDFREPIQQSSRAATVTIKGQVKWVDAQMLVVSEGGPREEASGYVTFRYRDLAAKSVVLQLNDKFLKIGNIEGEFFIVRIHPQGHYTENGGATMLRAYFLDRQPSRQPALQEPGN